MNPSGLHAVGATEWLGGVPEAAPGTPPASPSSHRRLSIRYRNWLLKFYGTPKYVIVFANL